MKTQAELKKHFQAELTQNQFTDRDFDLLFAQLKNKKNFDSFFKSAALLYKHKFLKFEILRMCTYSPCAKLEYIANNLQKIRNTKLSNEDIAEIGMKKNAIQLFKSFYVYSNELSKSGYSFEREQLVRILFSKVGIEKLEILFNEYPAFQGKSLKQEAITDLIVTLSTKEDVEIFLTQYNKIAQLGLPVTELAVLFQTTRLSKLLSPKDYKVSYDGVKVVADSSAIKRNNVFTILKRNSIQLQDNQQAKKQKTDTENHVFAKYEISRLQACERLMKKIISRLPNPLDQDRLFMIALPLHEGIFLNQFDYVFRYQLGIFRYKCVENKYYKVALYPKLTRLWFSNFESFCQKQQGISSSTPLETFVYPASESLFEAPLTPMSPLTPIAPLTPLTAFTPVIPFSPMSLSDHSPEDITPSDWIYMLPEDSVLSPEEQTWLDNLVTTGNSNQRDNLNTTSISSSFGMSSNFFLPLSPLNLTEQDNYLNAGEQVSNENNQFKKPN